MRKIIAIKDTLTNDIVGPLWLFRHDAPAIRQFGDIANTQGTAINLHIEDHELICLGTIDDDTLTITPDNTTIITGTQWRAAQQDKTNNNEE